MGVRDEQREIERTIFGFSQQLVSERAQARPGIEDDDPAVAADFDA